MSRLIDVSKLVLVSATCEAGGTTLHNQSDCPKDATCPVWVSFQPRAVRNRLYPPS